MQAPLASDFYFGHIMADGEAPQTSSPTLASNSV